MSGKRATKCPYEECYLPNNNVKYFVQLAYLIVSFLFLIKDSKEFTFFSLLMFVAPILLDLVYTHFRGKLYRTVSIFYIVINVAIGLFCFAGMFGFFVDMEEAFAVSETSLFLPKACFSKKVLLVPMALDLLIPAMMHKACPTKKSKAIVEFGREQRKAGC